MFAWQYRMNPLTEAVFFSCELGTSSGERLPESDSNTLPRYSVKALPGEDKVDSIFRPGRLIYQSFFAIKRPRRLHCISNLARCPGPGGPGVHLKPALNRGPAFINEVISVSAILPSWFIITPPPRPWAKLVKTGRFSPSFNLRDCHFPWVCVLLYVTIKMYKKWNINNTCTISGQVS